MLENEESSVENIIILLIISINNCLALTAFLFGLHKKRLYSILWAGLLLFQLTSYLNFTSNISEFGFDKVYYGQMLFLLGNITLFFSCIIADGFLIPKNERFSNIKIWLDTSSLSKKKYIIFVICTLGLIILLILRNGFGRINIGWEEARDSTNVIDVFLTILCFIIFPSIWVLFRSKRYFLLLIISMILLSIFQVIGSRAVLLTVITAIYVEILINKKSLSIKIWTLIKLGLLGFLIHTISRFTRGLGLQGLIDLIQNIGMLGFFESITQMNFSGGESDIIRYYNFVIQLGYDYWSIHEWPTLKRLALLYIPSSIIPDIKPMDITYHIWSDALREGLFNEDPYYNQLLAVAAEGQLGSLHPTLWGDAYINGGVLAIIIYSILLSTLLVLIDKFLLKLSPAGIFMLMPVTAVGYLMIARGNIVIGIGYLGYIIPIAIILAYIFSIKIIKNRPN
jgi:hypothetical protein